MSDYIELGSVAEFVSDRIDMERVNKQNYISTENMIEKKGGILNANSLPTSKTVLNYKPKDILISNIRLYFEKIWFADKEGGSSADVLVLRVKKGYSPKFIYYALSDSNFFKYADVTSKGTKMPRGDKKAILKYIIPDYPVYYQTKIADVLSTYDKLIENNNRRIQILEQTAEELYKEWFVRMRFPGYEKTKFHKGIPEGWEVRRIGDFIDLKSGYAFKSSWWKKTGIPVVKIKDIQNNTLDFSALSYVSTENAEKSKQFYLSPGDLLIALTGATIGKIALVPYFAYDKLTVNQRVGKFFLGDKPIENVAFFYFLFLQTHIQEQIISIGNSNAAQPNISPLDIKNIKILYNETVINKFNSSVKKYINLILKLKETNQNLTKQRDLLLPRLMNGTITVK